jgi:NADH:ubiquinone oxidoreductase subunit 2 (subunit N)
MITSEYAISKTRRGLTLSAVLRWLLISAALFALFFEPMLDGTGVSSMGVLLAVAALWLVLSFRSVRGSRAAADFDMTGEATRAILIYLAIYVFMNLGAFTVAGLIWRETGSELIEDYAGMGRRSPILAICMTIFMFSLVGLPPLAGFTAKVYVLWALIQNGGWWWALVAVIGINTILSLYYYVRVVKVMYLNSSDRPSFFPNPIGLGVSVLCAVMLLVMFIAFQPLSRIARNHSDVYLGDRSAPQAKTAMK